MRRLGLVSLLMCFLVSIVFITSCDRVSRTKDPLEVEAEKYFELLKAGKFDDAYALFDEPTQKYWKKEDFIKSVKEKIVPMVGNILIKRIEKRKLDATVTTEFLNEFKHLNSMPESLITLNYVYVNGQWKLTNSEIIALESEREAAEKMRKENADKWSKVLSISEFKVRTEIVDEGPALVFSGKITNESTETVEMVMVMVEFFDHEKKKIYNVVVTPIYISPREEKEALKGSSSQDYQITILSEIPDTWSGEVKYYVWNAGEMPTPQ